MTQITANLDDALLKEFRDVIYNKSGLRKGDFKKSLEEAKPYFVGWMELDNAFMVFLDEEMWKGARKLVNPLEYGKGGVPNAFKQGE